MPLPVKLRNVYYYRIAGKYIFAGDLFITRDKLYFFPEVDLEEQRAEISNKLPFHDLRIAAEMVMYVTQKFGSYTSSTHFWQPNITNDQFQFHATQCVEQKKAAKRGDTSGKLLPAPTVVTAKEVSNLKLGLAGVLSFSAQSDTHDFKIGLRRKRSVRDALWEAGFGKV
jgi:hypothetical protein